MLIHIFSLVWVLKCGAGEVWRRSVGPITWEMKKCYLRVNEQRNILHEIRKRKANWIGHFLRRKCLLKQVIEGKITGKWKWQEDEEEDVRSYWMTLRTGEDILIWRRRLWIALCGGIVLEEALDLSSDRILNEWMNEWGKTLSVDLIKWTACIEGVCKC